MVKSTTTILGAGSWGTALAIVLARNEQPVRLWGRGDYVKEMQSSRCNQRYLPGVFLSDAIQIYTDFYSAIEGAKDILIAVPSYAFRPIINLLHGYCPKNIRIAWATKGLDPQKNTLLHEVVLEIYEEKPPLAVISGPSFAKEVAIGLPTAVTLTSDDTDFANALLFRFHGHRFRVYTQTDLIGVQVCGAVKNCLAVAAGISDGLGYGANARSALITRGLTEMARLSLAMGGRQDTFMGLSGVGDLILTCTDSQSRNLRFGRALGKGSPIEQAEKAIGQVVEGKLNAFKVMTLAQKYQIEMPITEQVCAVLRGDITPFESVDLLFARESKHEKIW
jgi:glycerol-3-phosphate dehydrogenase (NAD(P)+)